MTRSAELVAALAGTWSATAALLAGRRAEDWECPTGCPGWTVRDQVSHLIWSADIWRGVAPEPIELPDLAHVQGPMAAYMELAVHARRERPGAEVLAEFDAARAAAIADLESRLPDGLDEPFAGPMGHEMPRSAFLAVSVFDQWTHGHDIACALGEEPDLTSPAAVHAIESMLDAWTARAEAIAPVAVEVDGRRCLIGGDDPVATIGLGSSDLVTLATGRDRPTVTLTMGGDRTAADAALALLPVTP